MMRRFGEIEIRSIADNSIDRREMNEIESDLNGPVAFKLQVATATTTLSTSLHIHVLVYMYVDLHDVHCNEFPGRNVMFNKTIELCC